MHSTNDSSIIIIYIIIVIELCTLNMTAFRTLDTDCSEYVETAVCSADHSAGALPVPMDFLDISLALVYKQQLRRYVHVLLTHFSCLISLNLQGK